jgi:hypothetical protein
MSREKHSERDELLLLLRLLACVLRETKGQTAIGIKRATKRLAGLGG